jgi:catechol 2,3-dioxygenase-like lactoylglutathione lyase family enzyme
MRPAISQEVVDVLDRFPTHTTLPASDLERAKAWYRDKLEFVPKEEDAGGVYYESGGRSFALFQTPYAGTAQNTAMEWSVDDVEKVVAHLKDRGVTFDTYDIPGVEWNGEIAIMGPFKGAWFKDSEGNILSLTQPADS